MGSGTDRYWKQQKLEAEEKRKMEEQQFKFKMTHRDADEIVVDPNTGKVLGAVYYSIEGKNKIDLLRFFKLLKNYLSQ